jgi:hypothetical protein
MRGVLIPLAPTRPAVTLRIDEVIAELERHDLASAGALAETLLESLDDSSVLRWDAIRVAKLKVILDQGISQIQRGSHVSALTMFRMALRTWLAEVEND